MSCGLVGERERINGGSACGFDERGVVRIERVCVCQIFFVAVLCFWVGD